MKQQVQAHITKKYQLVKKIGSGAYGHVWKVIDKNTKQVFALKKIFDAFQHSTDAQRTYRQIMFLQQFNHQNIIKLYDVIRSQNDKDIYLIFQFMQIDLHSVIRQNILKQKHKKYITYQIAKALKYLHSANLIHRDLKPSNILINSQCLIKVCDFGLVRSLEKKIDDQPPILTQYIATRWYRAPQILFGSFSYTKAVDIWSFGCLLAQMYKGKPFFPGTSTLNQIQRVLGWSGVPSLQDLNSLNSDIANNLIINMKGIRKKSIKEWLPGIDDIAKDLILKMLTFNPDKRIKIQQILSHPYLEQFYNPEKQKICQKNINILINDNQKLTVKEYKILIYKQISKRNRQNKNKQIENCDIKCEIAPHKGIKRKSFKSISRQEQDKNIQIQNPYAAKTLFIQNKKPPAFNTPDKKFVKINPVSKNQYYKKIKYFTETKQSSLQFHQDSITKPNILSSYNKKNSLKDARDITRQKRQSFDESLRKKSFSIYSTKNNQLAKQSLIKNAKYI